MIPAGEHVSVEQYLALERNAETRHEFVNGVIYAMAGGTLEHAAIQSNVIGHLRAVLRDRPCQVYTSDARVYVAATGLRAYPDVSVVCGPVERAADDSLSMVNPTALFEVRSESTSDWDRGGKFAHYRRLASLREYVVIAQDERLIEHHARSEAGVWTLRDVRDDGVIELAALGCALPLDEVYLKVALPSG